MTNKLPVVGNLYRFKDKRTDDIFRCVGFSGQDKQVAILVDHINPGRIIQHDPSIGKQEDEGAFWVINFFDYFEELPENKAEIRPTTQNHISELSPKMEKVLDEIRNKRKYLEGYDKGWDECLEEVKKQIPNHILELSPEVKEAMEALRIELDKFYSDLEPVAQNLLNALNKQFANND